jgi:hypothetical protein
MATIPYNTASVSGSKMADLTDLFHKVAALTADMTDVVKQHDVAGLRGTNFGVPDGPAPETINQHASAFNDSWLQFADAFQTFWGDGSGGTNREKLARFAR